MASKGLSNEIRSKLIDKMVAVYGDDSIKPFWQKALGSKPDPELSYETVSRILSASRGGQKGVTAPTLALLCEALDFTQEETRDILRLHEETSGRAQDRGLWKLVGKTVNELTTDETALLEAFREIRDHSPDQLPRIAEMVETVAQAGGVSVNLDALRRKKRKGGK